MQEDMKLHWILVLRLELEIYFSQKTFGVAGVVAIQYVFTSAIDIYMLT